MIATNICNDPLATNFQEEGECEFHGYDPENNIDNNTSQNSDCGCGGSNGSGTIKYLGMGKKSWIWIIIAAIVAYYFYKKRN